MKLNDRSIYPLGKRRTLVVLAGTLLGMLLASVNQTLAATALPSIVGRAGRHRALLLGLLRLRPGGDRLDPDLRQALRPLRPATALPRRHLSLLGRLRARRARADPRGARGRPRGPGARRRRADPARDRRHRRHHRAARARKVAGGERDGVRALRRRRADDGRLDRRQRVVAARVLREPAARGARARSRLVRLREAGAVARSGGSTTSERCC